MAGKSNQPSDLIQARAPPPTLRGTHSGGPNPSLERIRPQKRSPPSTHPLQLSQLQDFRTVRDTPSNYLEGRVGGEQILTAVSIL